MKKGMKTFLSIIGALALISGVGVAVYYGNDAAHTWIDDQITKIKGNGGTGSSTGESNADSETITNSDSTMGLVLPTGSVFGGNHIKYAFQTGATKTVIATIANDATIKTITWQSSDSTKVAVSGNTESGGTETLTLKSYFTGNVTITATCAGNNHVSCSFAVSMNNFVNSVTLLGAANYTMGEDVWGSSAASGAILVNENGYVNDEFFGVVGFSSGKCFYYLNEQATSVSEAQSGYGAENYLIFKVTGIIPTSKVSFADSFGSDFTLSWLSSHFSKTEYESYAIMSPGYDFDCFSSSNTTPTSKAGSISMTVAGVTASVATMAYVAPTSLTGSATSVIFN